MATAGHEQSIRLAAVGDILLAAGPAGEGGRGRGRDLGGVAKLFADCDIVFGNLECALSGDGGLVPTEPRVISTPDLVRSAVSSGFGVVTLANNHTFDCLEGGFRATCRLLEEMGVRHFGAGADLAQASAPAIVDVRGVRVAFIGGADRRSGTRYFAAADRWGVAPLDVDRICSQVRRLREECDHVIVSPHWGEERFLIPSPEQIDQARRMIEAGASMVLGHHPHVIQGMELRRGRPIAYSLGNFIANEVAFSDGDVLRWSRAERTGCLLTAELAAAGAVTDVRQRPTHDDGAAVGPAPDGFGQRRIDKANRALARGVTARRYRREHRRVKTYGPILSHLRWSELTKLRLRQLRKAIGLLRGAAKAR
jgi:poly-gamma-glutamate synthesis protein (capsule biosynthesis protein)